MRILLSLPLLLWIIFPAWGQNASGDEVLIRFKDKRKTTVTRSAFEYVYQKNNGGYDSARTHKPEQYREYLELYATFKRKVIQAREMGLDTTRAFRGELSTYLKQLAQPYLVKKEAMDALIREAYDHWRQAVSVSHILVRVPEEPTPADTLRAYQRALQLRDSLRSGVDFAVLAERHSEDPSAKDNRGFLGFFSAFDFVYPFEKAAYDTPVGQISQPVRTQYGYHLIKVHERIAAPGNREASHILIRYGANYGAKDSTEARKRAQELYDRVKKGEDFAALAKEHSDDPNSKAKGGDLGPRYLPVPYMQEMKYRMKNGEVSKPFQSAFGYHIMKVKVEDENKTFEDLQKVMRNRVTRDKRASIAEEELIAQLKSQYKYELLQGNAQKMIDNAGEAYKGGDYTGAELPKTVRELPLIRFADRSFTVADYLAELPRIRRRSATPAPDAKTLMNEDLETYSRARLLEHEEGQLEQKYPEFRHLKQEYHDGILLFTLTEKMVWRKAVEDSTGLRKFYDKNKSKYTAPERVVVIEYRSSVQESMQRLDSLMKSGVAPAVVDSVLSQELFMVRRSSQVLPKDHKRAAALYQLKEGERTPLAEENKSYVIYQVDRFRAAGIKDFEEARSEAITDYQAELEKRWIEDLAKKYKYTLDEKVFARLFRQ